MSKREGRPIAGRMTASGIGDRAVAVDVLSALIGCGIITPNFPGEQRRTEIAVKKAKTATRKAARATLPAEQLRNYELVLIISTEVAEDKVDALVESISQPIIKKGGEVAEVERWGKRKLAYPIKKATEGNYLRLVLSSKASATREMTKKLRITEDVLRHILIKLAAE
jgi:small subunit ribosomal protein S6